MKWVLENFPLETERKISEQYMVYQCIWLTQNLMLKWNIEYNTKGLNSSLLLLLSINLTCMSDRMNTTLSKVVSCQPPHFNTSAASNLNQCHLSLLVSISSNPKIIETWFCCLFLFWWNKPAPHQPAHTRKDQPNSYGFPFEFLFVKLKEH